MSSACTLFAAVVSSVVRLRSAIRALGVAPRQHLGWEYVTPRGCQSCVLATQRVASTLHVNKVPIKERSCDLAVESTPLSRWCVRELRKLETEIATMVNDAPHAKFRNAKTRSSCLASFTIADDASAASSR